uniref:Cystatin-B n=1 Tax=Aceria tosichella TaxID=561515 RepID=A0A6G1SLW5_9ACAR
MSSSSGEEGIYVEDMMKVMFEARNIRMTDELELGPVDEPDEDICKLVDGIKADLETGSGKKFETLKPVRVRPRFVSGKHMFVKAKAKKADGTEQIIHVKIFEPVSGPLELKAYQLNHQPEDELVGF